MTVYSVVVTDSAIGALGEASSVTRFADCPACHRRPDDVVNQVDYRLSSWDWEEWFLLDGAHVVSARVQQRLAAEPRLVWRDARVTAEGLSLLPFFQLVAAPQVPVWPGLVYEWFCEVCAETRWSLTAEGQQRFAARRVTLSKESWGDLVVAAQAGWPWLLVRDDVAESLRRLNVKNLDYIEAELTAEAVA